MELRHIRYFVVAAKERNFTKASHALNITQPAISRLIRDLECELDTVLFIRHRSGLELTPAGDVFFAHACRILNYCEKAIIATKEISPVRSKLHIGFIATALASFLGDMMKKLTNERPDIELVIHEMSPGDQIVALKNNVLDVAFVGNACDDLHNGIRLIVVKDLKLVAAIPVRHRLAERTAIRLRELESERFIGYVEERFPGRNKTIIKACTSVGFQPALSAKAGSLVEVIGMIGAGVGVCLMPSDVENLPHPNVVFVPLDDALEPIRLAAVWLPSNKNPALQHFINMLK